MHLGTINHPEPIIDRKVKHFYDHLRYLLSPNRYIISYPLENHLRLLERIQFKLDSPVLFPSSIKVITKYFNSHPLVHPSSDFFCKKEKNKNLLSKLSQLNSKKDIDDDFRDNIKKLGVELNGMNYLGGDEYMISILNQLVQCLTSKNPIEIEKSKIEYFSNLFLSEFLRVGFHMEDFTNIGGVMKRVLSNKIKIHAGGENDFHSVFPLPLDIESHRGKSDFQEMVKDFLKNRTFSQQFEGFYNHFEKDKEGEFLFRIYNVFEHNSDFSFEHNGVRIFHRSQLEINTATWEESYVNSFDKFIQEENTILVTVTLTYKSHRVAGQTAMFKIREAIDFLNFVSKDKKKNYNGAILDTQKNYIIFEGGKSIRGTSQADKVRTGNSKIKSVIDYLYPTGFENLNLKLQETIKQNDKILFRAKTTNYWDEKVNNYWRFLDGIFGHGLEVINGKHIIRKASKIILLSEERTKKERLEYTIVNSLHNSDEKMIKLKVSPVQISGILHQLHEKKIQFLDLKGLADYPFINERFEEYENLEVDYLAAHKFYQILLWETYEQRNFAFHQNVFCFSTVEKLINYLPNVVHRLREVIVDELISNKNLSIQESIESLYQKGSLLINQ